MSVKLRKKTLYDAYRFPGFTPVRELKGVFGDRKARVIRLNRRSKKLSVAPAGQFTRAGTTGRPDRFATYRVATTGFTSRSTCDAFAAGSAAP